jgi:hypothetical protein
MAIDFVHETALRTKIAITLIVVIFFIKNMFGVIDWIDNSKIFYSLSVINTILTDDTIRFISEGDEK